jgi:hypothetical protein
LTIEDPAQPGRNLASASSNMAAVRQVLMSACSTLESALLAPDAAAAAALARAGVEGEVPAGWCPAQARAASSPAAGGRPAAEDTNASLTRQFPLLSSAMSMLAAVGRGRAAEAERRYLSKDGDRQRLQRQDHVQYRKQPHPQPHPQSQQQQQQQHQHQQHQHQQGTKAKKQNKQQQKQKQLKQKQKQQQKALVSKTKQKRLFKEKRQKQLLLEQQPQHAEQVTMLRSALPRG